MLSHAACLGASGTHRFLGATWYQSRMGNDDKFPSQLAERFQVRMPEGMRDLIAQSAKANGRSMNSEIIEQLEVAYGLKTRLGDQTIRRSANVGGLMVAAEAINELLKYANIKTSDLPDHIAYLIEHTKYLRDTIAHGKDFADRAHARASGNRLRMEKVDYPNAVTNFISSRNPRGAYRIKPGQVQTDDPESSN
jgi:hypothetical protein